MAKMITGIVSSKKTDKTIVVTEHVRLTHPLYRKQYTVTKKFMAHDENNEAQEGDKVTIVETRPISARKHFKLDRVIEKAGIKHVEAETPVIVEADTPDVADAGEEK
jgi:small subunit ribosomal protein S17